MLELWIDELSTVMMLGAHQEVTLKITFILVQIFTKSYEKIAAYSIFRQQRS